MQYTWKRDFYETLKAKALSNNVTALMGPYKCGKTAALLQLNGELPNSGFYNAKKMPPEQHERLLARILNSIGNDEDFTFIIDEISQVRNADSFIEKIAVQYNTFIAPRTHVVLSDSQAAALHYWMNRSFCGCAGYVYADFMGYDEWLRMKSETSPKGYEKPTERNYAEYVANIGKFHQLPDIKQYLHFCLENADLSVKHSSDLKYINHEVEGLTEQILSNILLATLSADSSLPSNDFLDRLDDVLIVRALIFLKNCGLISVFGVGDSFNRSIFGCPLDCRSSEERKAAVYNKETLFRSVGLSVTHPMFVISLAEEMFGKVDFERIPEPILAAAIEAHCRGLLPERGAYMFRADGTPAEQTIGYVNPLSMLAVDFSLSDESIDRFERAAEYAVEDEDFLQNKCVKLSKQRSEERITAKGIKVSVVPYYEYLYRLSVEYDIRFT